MQGVDNSCPQNLTEAIQASKRLGCGRDKYDNDQYICLPNTEKSGLVELCHNGIMGLIQKGNCLETTGGNLFSRDCSGFIEGCPDDAFRSNENYHYPACQQINTQDHCYLAHPSCSATNQKLDHGVYNSTAIVNQTTTIHAYETGDMGAIVGALCAGLIVSIVLLFLGVWWKRKQRGKNVTNVANLEKNESGSKDDSYKSCSSTVNESSTPLLPTSNTVVAGKVSIENDGGHDIVEDRSSEGEFDIFRSLDNDYNTWKTGLADQFSKLTDDEVSVLFCFLCSDSAPPDFTNTEWLDLLNVIRQGVYRKENTVTREEAKQTLDRLKSRDYLWEDDHNITRDTKDETMYRIASINGDKPFLYSSYETASVYLRSKRNSRKRREKCVIRYFLNDYFLIFRLQMNILTHETMEDTEIYNAIHQILNVSKNIQNDNKDQRETFLMDLRNAGEAVHYIKRPQDSIDHVTWLWKYRRPGIVRSCIGLYPHNDIYIIDNKPYRKPSKYHNYTPEVRCLLYCLLLNDKYQMNLDEQSHRMTRDKIRERYFPDITDDGSEHLPEEITKTPNGVVTFNDIRHDVMYAFVTECLVEDSDLEFFLTTASRDVISEYCRSWLYKRNEGERCLYVPFEPKKMNNLFLDKLGLDIISHCTVSDRWIHNSISKKLNIPEEILNWDTSERKRFAESLSHGGVKMVHARGMIVGCAGAGKTTLLRKLQRKYTEENQPTETTVGLEVHNNLFRIENGTLHDGLTPRFFQHDAESDKEVIKGILYHSSRDTKFISMTDFAGQVAYYACHQVYLSRRAFYIVVVDMSKGLEEEVKIYNTDRQNLEGSMFHSWKYKDYFHFWLQSIQTYCDAGKAHTIKERKESSDSFCPLIIVASHADNVEEDLHGKFYEELENCLSAEQSLKNLMSPNRYLNVECPPNELSPKQLESIERLRKCIVETVEMMPQWGEVIPLKWANLEKVLIEIKENGKKVISVQQLKEINNVNLPCDRDLYDGLRFLHEIGQIIYFANEKMKNVIIVDVQWFADVFKYIISDAKHLARIKSKNKLINTGRITDIELTDIWAIVGDRSYFQHKEKILPYMDKLGLMTEIQDDPRSKTYYIPSMNRTELTDSCKGAINKGQKTSIMVFHFKTYLPHFFFFRLVVYCFREWKALDMEFFCKNAAFYVIKDVSHYIAIAVNKTSIQLQVFTADKDMDLQSESVIQIRNTVESLINEITQTFHRHIEYERGFSCTDINITDEDDEYFFRESQILEMKSITGKEKRSCPKHVFKNPHDINKYKMMQYWFK